MLTRTTLAFLASSLAVAVATDAAAALRCNSDHALSQALIDSIHAKARLVGDPVRYCQMERRQLWAAQAFYTWIKTHPDCFRRGANMGYVLSLAAGTIRTARKDVAEDCR